MTERCGRHVPGTCNGQGTECSTRRREIFAHELISEARAWLDDCFDDVPADMTDAEVMTAVKRHYAGGWRQFARDNR
jgi:hypothetical protein